MIKQIKVCTGISCSSKGANAILHKIETETGLQKGGSDDKMSLDICTCTGHCQKSPNIRVNNLVAHNVTTENVMKEIDNPTDFTKEGETKNLDLNIDELIQI